MIWFWFWFRRRVLKIYLPSDGVRYATKRRPVMRFIRNTVYRLGIRPRPGSIFFSPSRAFLEQTKNVHRVAIVQLMESGNHHGR